MQNTFITPITGQIPKDYSSSIKTNFIDEDKSNHLNKILRGEISAVAAYEQIIPTFGEESDRVILSGIQNEHLRNIEKLKMLIENTAFAPDEDSGVWGTFVTTFVGSARIIGHTATLNALIGGEEHGIKLYRDSLKHNLTIDEKDIIFHDIIPGMYHHVSSLESMVKTQNDYTK